MKIEHRGMTIHIGEEIGFDNGMSKQTYDAEMLDEEIFIDCTFYYVQGKPNNSSFMDCKFVECFIDKSDSVFQHCQFVNDECDDII